MEIIQLKKKKKYAENKEVLIALRKSIAKYESLLHDKRANTLKFGHPLRMQVNIRSGVANGVLVCRDFETCARLIYSILTNQLEFDIFEPGQAYPGEKDADNLNFRLVEKISGCVFRIVTKDEMLTE